MRTIRSYIFRQTLGPLFFFATVMVGIVWLTQALQFLDLIINRGQSARTFAQLSLLILPSILKDALPIALFCAVLYALNRLRGESELVVMGASGMSKMSITRPLLAVATSVFLFAILLTVVISPLSFRLMKERLYDIRGDLATALVKEGQFATPVIGFTVFVREITGPGELRGILVHDDRPPTESSTYIAERGLLVRADEGPHLILGSGSIQTRDKVTGKLTIVQFDRYTLDLVGFFGDGRQRSKRDLAERGTWELFSPPAEDTWARENRHRLLAEANDRIASPLYAFAFTLLAATAVVGGSFSRRGYGHRVVIVILLAISLRLLGFIAQGVASDAPMLAIAGFYALPLGAAAICLLMLSRGKRSRETVVDDGPAAAMAT